MSLPKVAVYVVAAVVLLIAGSMVYFRAVSDDPAVWHVDPVTAGRTGRPNDVKALPPGLGEAEIRTEVRPVAPEALAERFHAVATAAPRVSVVGGGPDEAFTTYVQRSAVFGFPDYVSVRAVEVEGGAALAIFSRSRYGQSDLGVNRARVEDWLSRLEAPAPAG